MYIFSIVIYAMQNTTYKIQKANWEKNKEIRFEEEFRCPLILGHLILNTLCLLSWAVHIWVVLKARRRRSCTQIHWICYRWNLYRQEFNISLEVAFLDCHRFSNKTYKEFSTDILGDKFRYLMKRVMVYWLTSRFPHNSLECFSSSCTYSPRWYVHPYYWPRAHGRFHGRLRWINHEATPFILACYMTADVKVGEQSILSKISNVPCHENRNPLKRKKNTSALSRYAIWKMTPSFGAFLPFLVLCAAHRL